MFPALPGGDGVPEEPDWSMTLDDPLEIAMAHESWGLIIREMKGAGTLSVANGHAIMRLCFSLVLYDRSVREVAENGSVVRAKKSGVLQYSPYWVVVRQLDNDIRTGEAHLGISPLGRRKVGKATRTSGQARASDKYLKPRSA